MKNIVIAQSGGPTAAINATLAGVLQAIAVNKQVDNVYGAKNGIDGVLKEEFIDLNSVIQDTQIMDGLKYTPSSALGTCRTKMGDWRTNEDAFKKVIDVFYKHNVKYFIYIGGNDSMDTVHKLDEYCKLNNHDFIIMGAPKTVDNDLNLTDHCPGFGSAAKFIATTVSEIERDIGAFDVPAVTIVEIMGRNAGWLTAASALARLNGGAGPDLIYLCEKPLDNDKFVSDVRKKLENKSGILVAVSEGVKNSQGNYVSDETSSGAVDNFGHKYIAGAARALEQLLNKEIGCKTRSIELNLMQRSAAHIASETDIIESCMLGQKAYTAAINGETGQMSAIKRISDEPYVVEYTCVPVDQVANAEKIVPLEWINSEGNDVTSEMISYLKPLIQGETNLKFENGIPKQVKLY